MTVVLTLGQRHEAGAFDALLMDGAVKRRERPKRRPSPYRRRQGLQQRQNSPVLAPSWHLNHLLYRQRERMERLINQLKHNSVWLHAMESVLPMTVRCV